MSGAIHDHSRWGPGDQLGAGNHLTTEKRLEALALIGRGQLGRENDCVAVEKPSSPASPPRSMPRPDAH
jgi:hypothetical protein